MALVEQRIKAFQSTTRWSTSAGRSVLRSAFWWPGSPLLPFYLFGGLAPPGDGRTLSLRFARSGTACNASRRPRGASPNFRQTVTILRSDRRLIHTPRQ